VVVVQELVTGQAIVLPELGDELRGHFDLQHTALGQHDASLLGDPVRC